MIEKLQEDKGTTNVHVASAFANFILVLRYFLPGERADIHRGGRTPIHIRFHEQC